MTTRSAYLAFGTLLILLGVLLLAQAFTGLFVGSEVFGGALLWLGALWFWTLYEKREAFIWLLLGFLAAFSGLAAFNGGLGVIADDFFGPLFLWGLGATLALHWFQHRRSSAWLVFGAGTAVTLGFVAFVEEILPWYADFSGGLFFLGLAATFWLLHRLFEAETRLAWAKYAAAVSAALAAVVFSEESYSAVGDYLSGGVLILLGAYLLWYAMRREAEQQNHLGSA